MKNTTKAIILIGALMQGGAVMGLEVTVSLMAAYPDGAGELDRYKAFLTSPSGPNQDFTRGAEQRYNLNEGDSLSIIRGGKSGGTRGDPCTVTLRNNTLVQGSCYQKYWSSEIQGNKVVFKYMGRDI